MDKSFGVSAWVEGHDVVFDGRGVFLPPGLSRIAAGGSPPAAPNDRFDVAKIR